MLVLREAHEGDVKSIANLHAMSWQQNYRGVFSDNYLDNEVVADRLAVWSKRFTNQTKKQQIVVAEDSDKLLGFYCVYFNENATYGTYLDNLHVSKNAIGKGIGSRLMGRLVEEMVHQNLNTFYLWVLENNNLAISFYEGLLGRALEKLEADDIGDAPFIKVRYVWNDMKKLQSHINAKLKKYEH